MARSRGVCPPFSGPLWPVRGAFATPQAGPPSDRRGALGGRLSWAPSRKPPCGHGAVLLDLLSSRRLL
eukprot:2369323-Pyramimonas_sp.AAC.1